LKLMVVLGLTNDLEEVRKYFEKHIGGFINEVEH